LLPPHSPTHLGKSKPLGTPKERLRISKQRLDLLHQARHSRLEPGLGVGVRLREYELLQVGLELAEEGVDEEGDAGAAQGALDGVGGGDQVGRVGVSQELGDDAGLGDDLVVEAQRGNQAAGVDLEVGLGARLVEVDQLLLVGDAELV